MPFVDVYSRSTGAKQTVPEEWLEHPVLGQDFRKTPLSEKQAEEARKQAEEAARAADAANKAAQA